MTNQKLLLLVIISFILMTLMCDSGGILWSEIWCLSLSEFKGLKFVTKMFFYYPSWLESMHLGFDAAQVYNWIIFLTYILVIQLCSHMYMVWWYSNCLQFFKWKLWYNFVSLSAYAFELTIEIFYYPIRLQKRKFTVSLLPSKSSLWVLLCVFQESNWSQFLFILGIGLLFWGFFLAIAKTKTDTL